MTDTYFSHQKIVNWRCVRCARWLWDIQTNRKWINGVPTPVCEEADNLTILERRDND